MSLSVGNGTTFSELNHKLNASSFCKFQFSENDEKINSIVEDSDQKYHLALHVSQRNKGDIFLLKIRKNYISGLTNQWRIQDSPGCVGSYVSDLSFSIKNLEIENNSQGDIAP